MPEAAGSPYIPAQEDFVQPVGIRSVLGFGGMLPGGDIFVVILFSRGIATFEKIANGIDLMNKSLRKLGENQIPNEGKKKRGFFGRKS